MDVWETYTRAELQATGVSRRDLARSLQTGMLLRARRDRYVDAGMPAELRAAVRLGGRLTCLSLLQLMGVFVLANTQLHVHVNRGASRLRSPGAERAPMPSRAVRTFRTHWLPLARLGEGSSTAVGVVDALIHAVLCQPARHAIATLDSALHLLMITTDDLGDIFSALPPRFGVLRSLIDDRAESGPETLMRLMLRSLGCAVLSQVTFIGIGRVDFVVDKWLVVECDSREFHESWEQQVKDRERDLALAARGYVTLRVTAAMIMYRPDEVLAALRGVLRTHG